MGKEMLGDFRFCKFHRMIQMAIASNTTDAFI